jgi:hypothetical protein
MGGQQIQPDLAILTIHTGLVTFHWAYHLRCMDFPGAWIFLHSSNAPYDVSRESITRTALNYPSIKYFFFIDSDTCPPLDAVPFMIKLAEENKIDVLSGLYWARKMEGNMVCAWNKIGENKEKNEIAYAAVDVSKHLNQNALIPVDVAGCGCLLIRPDVFRKLDQSDPKKPFFQWGVGRKYDTTGEPLLQVSEDFYVFERIRNELKIQPYLSTAVKCDHLCTTKKRGQDGAFELI